MLRPENILRPEKLEVRSRREKLTMSQPFSYYGGKQRMLGKILPLIPKHTVYVEPFFGGGTVFWNKPFPKVINSSDYREVINDLNYDVFNFYECLKNKPDELIREIETTPYSEEYYRIAKSYYGKEDIPDVKRAWALFVNANMSFAKNLNSGWGRGVFSRNLSLTWNSKISEINKFANRLLEVHIACSDAIKVIKDWDSPQTFFYLDPPYIGTHCAHYKGYSDKDMDNLCGLLDSIEGSFLLSCYENKFTKPNWQRFEYETVCSARGRSGFDKSKKIEKKELGDTDRLEIIYRKFSKTPRPEIINLYKSGAYNCFCRHPWESTV